MKKENQRKIDFSDLADAIGSSVRVTSEEETRQREEELIQSKITPELLTYFNPSEARTLVEYFNSTPGTATKGEGDSFLRRLSQDSIDFLNREIKGRKVLELGNRGWKVSYDFDRLGATSYEGCDPGWNVDGLTFLIRQPNESAIVTSFGVLDSGVLYMDGCQIDPLLKKYTKELSRQIYRVTPKRDITLHGSLDTLKDLTNAGFDANADIPQNLRGYGMTQITALRKR